MHALFRLRKPFVYNIGDIVSSECFLEFRLAGGVDSFADKGWLFAADLVSVSVGGNKGVIFFCYIKRNIRGFFNCFFNEFRRCAAAAAENSRAGNGNFPHTVGKDFCVYIEFGLAVFSGRKTRVRVYDDRNGGIFAKLLHYRKHFIRPQRAVNAERVNAESFKQSDHCRRVCAGH